MKKVIANDSAFHELSGFHDEVQRLVGKRHIKSKIVLDIGSGFGWFEYVFAKDNPKKMIGIDVSSEVILEAKKVAKEYPIVEFKKYSGGKLPFANNSVDTVVTWEVLEHIPNGTEQHFFNEIHRVLKPKGNMFLSTQHRSIVSTILDPAWWLVSHRHYTKEQVQQFAADAGFKVGKIYTKGGTATVINILNMYIAKWIFKRKPFFSNYFKQKVQNEFRQNDGFVNIFLQCQKAPKN